MKNRLLPSISLVFASLFLSSCESTLDFGYYVGELNDQTILQLFTLSDEACNNKDIVTYSSFFAPDYVSLDKSESNRSRIYRQEYLDMVEGIFDTAKEVFIHTVVMDIEYMESGMEAIVKIQEEEKVKQFANTRHYTSLLDVEVGFENGWIFINKTTRTSKQTIEE